MKDLEKLLNHFAEYSDKEVSVERMIDPDKDKRKAIVRNIPFKVLIFIKKKIEN